MSVTPAVPATARPVVRDPAAGVLSAFILVLRFHRVKWRGAGVGTNRQGVRALGLGYAERPREAELLEVVSHPRIPVSPHPRPIARNRCFASKFVVSRRIASRNASAAAFVSARISSTLPRNTYTPDDFGNCSSFSFSIASA